MKKKLLFIIPGICILLLVFGVWVYLMVYGVPNNQNDVFANLGIGNGESDFVAEPPTPTPDPVPIPEVTPEALRQLTIRPVAGAALIDTEGITRVRYAERGTGHIYEISPNGEGERRLSGTTIPRVTNARFAPNGAHVALSKEEVFASETVIGTFTVNDNGDAVLDTFELPVDARNVAFSSDSSTIRFTITSDSGTRGYAEDIASGAREQLFNIPLRDIIVDWHARDEFLVRTKPSADREGFAYQLVGSDLTRLTSGGDALMTLVNDTFILRSYNTNTNTIFEAIDRVSGETTPLPLSMLPEKCAFSPLNEQRIWCAAPNALPNDVTYPDDWYKGLSQSEDALWEINIPAREAILRSDFIRDASRTLDATKLTSDGLNILFINRLDGTLWLFDSTI